MGRNFANIAFTPLVQQQQQLHNSRTQYARIQQSGDPGDLLGPDEQSFLRARDGFYMATVSETGWPYMQFRGGNPGFLHILDDRTLAFADLRGNKQYISTGNLLHDDRVALFFMDYAHQARLKILGHATIHEGPEAAPLLAQLRDPAEKAPAERAITITLEAFDWNCPQHITPRYTQQELADLLAPTRQRIADLEVENQRLRTQLKI